ncbi:MAG: M48 family metallopeptidase [Bacteroidota bacterium]
MKKMLWLVAPLFALLSCSKNAVTGRTTLPFVSEAQMQQMADPQYDSFLRVNRVLSNSDAAMVKRVGQKIASAITTYYQQQGKPEVLEGYKWEYNLVDSKEANAWCMPGGKIVVYTGLLPLTQSEGALAVVMGHEVAHAILQHGTSRMNEAVLTQLGGTALSVLLSTKSEQTQNIFLSAYGIGTQFGSALPNSRKQELEADRYGLLFCALAGYDPRVAVPFWERMAAASNGSKPPEFFSTHPADATRIAKIKEYLPEALKSYKGAK